jgi:hypothetical protein
MAPIRCPLGCRVVLVALVAALGTAAGAVEAGPARDDGAQALKGAREARQAQDYPKARKLFSQAAESGLPLRDRLSARIELGDTCWEAGDLAGARAAYGAVWSQSEAPPAARTLAGLRIAAGYEREKNIAAARSEYEKIVALDGAPAHHVEEAQERLRELERQAAGRRPRDPTDSRAALPRMTGQSVEFHVAPGGDDGGGDGSPARPFASIDRARDAVRELKRRGPLPTGAAVVVHGGDYPVARTFKLAAEDSGTERAPVVYRSAAGEAPRFRGGATVQGFEPVRDPAVLARLPEASRAKVVRADLKAQGIVNYGAYTPGGFASGSGFRTRPILEVFFDGRPLQLARWPNAGYARIANVSGEAPVKAHGIAGSKKGVFAYEGDRPARWKNESDLWLYGYFFWDWADSYEKVESIDTEKRQIALAEPTHKYGFRKGQRYVAINALAELDVPGEWYLDRAADLLYLYPPSDPARAVVEVSLFDAPMVELDGASHVVIRGLTWDLGRADAIRIRGGSDCVLAGCAVRRFAGDGVVIQGGRGHRLIGCDIERLGRGGAIVRGGDRKTLSPGAHVVENCHIHDFSRIDHTYTPAILVDGVGHRVAHNLMHRSTSSAMRVEGNDHRIELNEIHSVLLESDDQGGADMWGDPTYRGNVYRWNYWHHIGNGLGCGQAGIRLDDAICGTRIVGNVFFRCSDGGFGGVQIHGGKDNWIDNNVFVDCKFAVSFSPWGEKRWKETLASNFIAPKLGAVSHDRPPYVARYPELARLAESADVNHIWCNVALGCGKLFNREVPGQDALGNAFLGGGLTAGKGPLRLKDLADVLARLPFRPVPLEAIGLYRDDLRAVLPVVEPVTPK